MFQIEVYDLETGAVRMIGKPARFGAPVSWAPEGDALILKRFEDAPGSAIETRIICTLELDGKVTDLRKGDSPVVLRKRRKILFEEPGSNLWHLCDLDGTGVELYADGMKGCFTPVVSPDEDRILFMRKKEEALPELFLFEFGKSEGNRVLDATGYLGMPVWR